MKNMMKATLQLAAGFVRIAIAEIGLYLQNPILTAIGIIPGGILGVTSIYWWIKAGDEPTVTS